MQLGGLGQEKAAAIAGISRETWAQIEKGIRTSYSHKTLFGVCRALQWSPESIDLILAGKEPIEVPDDGATLRRVELVEKELASLMTEFATLRSEVREALGLPPAEPPNQSPRR
jgi:DNA-binding XRE family transcriptional regulator